MGDTVLVRIPNGRARAVVTYIDIDYLADDVSVQVCHADGSLATYDRPDVEPEPR